MSKPKFITNEIEIIFSAIESMGGEAYFCGGCIRDHIMGIDPKDIDIEIFGINLETLQQTLSQFGKIDTVGASFGITKLTTKTTDYDFSLPRRDNKIGIGHKDFTITIDHTMTRKEAASRRDFTMNAMSMDIQGNIYDPFNGIDDIKNKIIRHTSKQFSEDPLRALRGMQFAARFGFTIAPETCEICKEMMKGEF